MAETTPDKIQILKKKLEAFAQASQELNEAWDLVDGNPELVTALEESDSIWPFLDVTYYQALEKTMKWANLTADQVKS